MERSESPQGYTKSVKFSRAYRSSRPPLTHLASAVFNSPLAIIPEKLEVILSSLGPRLVPDHAALRELINSGVLHSQSPLPPLPSHLTWDEEAEGGSEHRPYRVTEQGVAIIPVQGVLMKKGSWISALSGFSSYDRIGASCQSAMLDAEVRALLLDIDSPGGTTHGCFELSDLIYSLRGEKPIVAVANDLAASAAYAIASAADKVFVTRTGAVGSVGVFMLHVDQSKADSAEGLSYTYIYAGDRKVDGNPHEPLSSAARASAKAEVDREYNIFTATVARNRGQKQKKIEDTEAEVLFAESSIPLLADAVGTFDEALEELTGKISGGSVTLLTGSNTGTSSQLEGAVEVEQSAPPPAEAGQGDSNMPVDIETLKANKAAADQALAEALAAQTATQTTTGTATINLVRSDGIIVGSTSLPTPVVGLAPVAPQAEKDCYPKGSKGKKSAKHAEPDGDEDEDGNEPPGPEEEDREAKGRADAVAISQMCMIAGRPELAADYLSKGYSVEKAREELYKSRASMSASNSINPNFGAVSTAAVDTIEKQVSTLTASDPSLSKEKALERVLKANPNLYAQVEEDRMWALQSQSGSRNYSRALTESLERMGLSTAR